MYSPYKRLIAQLLLFSFLLESCYNPNIGVSKKMLPTPKGVAFQQYQYKENTYSKNLEPLDHIYIGKTETHEQYISKITTKQPKEHSQPAETNTQEQASLQIIPSPTQIIPASPNSQPQASSKPLPISGSEPMRYNNAHNTHNNAHKIPNKRTPSLKNQHALAHSQQAAQNKRTERTVRAKPTNKPAPTARLKQTTPPTTLQTPSPTAKIPQDIASPEFVAQGGQYVHFMHKNDQWQASVRERIGAFSRTEMLPVFCERHGDIAAALLALQGKPGKYVQQRIHVVTARQVPYVPKFVFIGKQGLKGGGDSDAGPSGSGEPPTRGHAAATDRRARPSLAATGWSVSMALRNCMAKADITSTEDLVKSLNAAQTAEEQQALQEWVRAYIEWFNKEPTGNLTRRQGAAVQEYSLLAGIRTDNAEQQQLLRDYFHSLCNKIDEKYQNGETPLLQALEYTLQSIDREMFAGNPHSLIQLGNKLLAKLNPSNHFSKETYPTHRSLLYALHQVLVLIREIASSQWNPNQKDGLYSQFRARIQAIAESSQYYPVCYHARLLEQSLQRLALAGNRARLQDRLRRAGHGLEGAAYLYKGVRSLATLDFDLESFVSGYESIQAAFDSRLIAEEPWYDCLQSMNHACLLSLDDAAQYQVFAECLQMLKANEISMFKAEDRTALRYGIIQQLSLLALEGRTATIRKASMEELESLTASWSEDAEILEGLLDSLADIAVHSQGREKEEAEAVLVRLTDRPPVGSTNRVRLWRRERCKAVALEGPITNWLGGQTLADKLSTMLAPAEGPDMGGLFSAIDKELRGGDSEEIQAAASVQETRESLKAYYRQADFAQVRSLFDGDAPKHVETLQCQLMLIEQVEVKEDPDQGNEGQGSAPGGRQDQLATHHERLQQVKTPIELEDMFKNRSVKPDEPEREVDKILLVGEVGTGKTTLSKKLAYSWAQGSWGQAFEAVYVLPVRALQESQYDNLHFRREVTLATAIVNNCFAIPPSEEEAYKSLRRQVSEELGKPTTLVVLDGLDERYGASEQLLNQAKGGKHKLLMLSRPYGIEVECPLADIEIEHAGFNDAQMQAFISDELSSALGEELLAFIREHPAIEAIAHVPVNLQILCALWKDDSRGVRAVTRHGSLPGLYGMLTRYTCDRYEERQRKVSAPIPYENREELFDTLGEIALDALEQEEVLISQGLVDNVLGVDAATKDMLKDAGFLLLQDLGKQYQFPHLTFQEYFAGRWLARQFLSGETRERGRVEKFFMKHKYEGQYGVTFSFMAGELSKRGGVEGIRQMLELVEEDPREVVGVQQVLLQVRLLHEFLSVSGDDLEADLAELERKFQVLRTLEGWFGKGLDQVRRGGYSGDASKLLELLTSGLQGSRAVAAHAPVLREVLLQAVQDSSDWVRRAAVSALGQLVAAVPADAPVLLEVLLKALKDSDHWVRRAAVSALGQLVAAVPADAPVLLEVLLQALKDSNKYVRLATVWALVKIVAAVPADAPVLLEVLLQALKDLDDDIHSAVVPALGQLVKAAPGEAPVLLEVLLQALKDSEWRVRSAAVSALEALVKAAPGEAPVLREVLFKALKDDDWSVRRAAVEALGELVAAAPTDTPVLLEVLLQALKDEDYFVRFAAVSALGELVAAIPAKAPGLREPLLQATQDRSPWVRSATVSALEKLVAAVPADAPGLREDLLQALKDSDDDVRSAAVSALGELVAAAPADAPGLREPLLQATQDRSPWVRFAAVSALEALVKAVPGEAPVLREDLLQALKDLDDDVRFAAVSALEALVKVAPGEAPVLLEDLLQALKDSDDDIRSATVSALVKFVKAVPTDAPGLLEDLLQALKDSDDDVRLAAVSALGEVVAAVPADAPGLREPLLQASKYNDKYVRRAAVSALGQVVAVIPTEAPVLREPLLKALKDSEWSVRRAAVSALGQVVAAIPSEALVLLEDLLQALKDDDKYVRRAAVSALGQVVAAVPAEAPGLREVLLQAAQDSSDWVRRAAEKALVKIVAAIPAEAPVLLEVLLKASKDSEWSVRRAAGEALEKVIQAASQEVPGMLEVLLQALKDSEWSVHSAAGEALEKVIQATPQEALGLLEVLLDSNKYVSRATREALGKFSIQQLMEGYWATKNQAFISPIVARLYHVPLTISDKSDHQRLVLYPTTGESVTWNKPQQEVERFVELIKSEIKQGTADRNRLCIIQ